MILGVIAWHPYRLIHLGGLSISPHGIGIAVGYALGGTLMARRAERWGISRDDVWNMLMRAVIGVIIGARLFYVVGHFTSYFPHASWIDIGRGLRDVAKVWEGGVVFYGGVFGGIIAAVPYMRKHNLPFGHVMDAAAPGFPLGLIFGRIGDLIVGDHLGGASTLPFAFRFTTPDVAHPNPNPECFLSGCHQTALYDLWNVIVLLPVVLWLARKRWPNGFLIMFTATWYGGVRLFVDFARDATTYWGLRGTQWVSLVLLIVGSAYLARLAMRGERAPEPVAVGPPDAPVGTERVESEAGPPEKDPSPPEAE